MATTTTDELDDAEAERLERRLRGLNDDDLVFCLLGLLGSANDDEPMVASRSNATARMARLAFAEVAERWLPTDVFLRGVDRLYEERPHLALIEGGGESNG